MLKTGKNNLLSHIQELHYSVPTNLDPSLTQTPGRHILLTPCIQLVMTCAAPMQEAAPGFLRAYNLFMKLYQKDLTFLSDGSGEYRRVNKKTLDNIPRWFDAPEKWDEELLWYDFQAGGPVEKIPPGFEIMYDPHQQNSFFAMSLPLQIVEDGSLTILSIIDQIVGTDFPFASGWCGYSLTWDNGYIDLTRPHTDGNAYFVYLLKKFPGLLEGWPSLFSEQATTGIVTVNWLTLLGTDLTKCKGGYTIMKKNLDKDILLHEVGKGVCLQAGSMPQLGDLTMSDDLPLYRKVGAFLQDIMPEKFASIFPEKAESIQWLDRFNGKPLPALSQDAVEKLQAAIAHDEQQEYLRTINNETIYLCKEGKWEEAIKKIEPALPYLSKNPYLGHTAACAYAQTGQLEQALKLVEQTVALGYDHIRRMEEDPDLQAIAHHPRFKKLFKEEKQK